jgi:hypothetical protein
LGAAGHVFGFLLSIVRLPFALLYNLVVDLTSNNTLQNQKKTAIKPDDLDGWMNDIINNINNIKNLHQRTKDNILKELNSLKDEINRNKSSWVAKKSMGDNSNYVEKDYIDKRINEMIDDLKAAAAASAAAEQLTIKDAPRLERKKLVTKAKALLEKLNKDTLDQASAIQDSAIEEYSEIMNQNGVWAGEIEISAFVTLFNCKVEIIKTNETPPQTEVISPKHLTDSTKTIKVYYTGNHYNAHKSNDVGSSESVIPVEEDGNCLFRALLESAQSADIALEGLNCKLDQDNHLALRKHILQQGIKLVDKTLLLNNIKVAMEEIVKPKDFHEAVDQADQFSDNIEFGVVAATRHLLKAMLDADGKEANTHEHVLPPGSFMKRIKKLNPRDGNYLSNLTTIGNEFKQKVDELLTKTQDELFKMQEFTDLERGHHKWLKDENGDKITDQAAIDKYKTEQHQKYQKTLRNVKKALNDNTGNFFKNYAKAMHSSETALYGIKVNKVAFDFAAKQYLESKDWSNRHADTHGNPLAKNVWHRYMSTFAVARIIDAQGNVIRTKDRFVGKIDIECNFTYPNFNSYFVKKDSRDSSSTTEATPSDDDIQKMKSQITDQIKLYVAALKDKAGDKNYALILPKPNAFINQITKPDNITAVKNLIINGVKEALRTLDAGETSKLHLCLLGMDFFKDVDLGSFGIDGSRVSVSNSESGSLIEKLSECGIVAMDPSMGNSSAGQGNGATGPSAWSGKDEQDARQTLGCGLASLDSVHFKDNSVSSIKGQLNEANSILKMKTNASGSAASPEAAEATPAEETPKK